MDLTPYRCRGFGALFDSAMADVAVRGIDREQTLGMIRLCPETEPVLYGDFSPRKIRYRPGARPQLEKIAAQYTGAAQDRVAAAANWVSEKVRHAHFIGPVPPDRAMTEEQLIASGQGWCNEQSRVFIAFCEVMQIPARLCFLFHKNGRTAHTATEVLLDGRWAFHDVTYGVRVQLPDGRPAEARDLQGQNRPLAHAAYRRPLEDYYRRGANPSGPGSPPVETGGDYLHGIGICNYLIEGAEAIHE